MSIEGTLFKSNFIGKDGFVWWIGRVADAYTWFNVNQEKSFSGEDGFRCKVRIIGYHPFDNTLKENDLPWATVMMDAAGGSGLNGPSKTMQLKGGETCVGFFLDGEDGQQPVIIGLLHRNANVTSSTTPEENQKEGSSGFKNLPISTQSQLNRTQTTTTSLTPSSTGIGATAGGGVSAYCLLKDGNNVTAGAKSFEQLTTQTVVKPSPCKNDFIGRITQILQDFIGSIAILEKGITGFVNPVLNKIVDVTSQIKSVASQIGGIVKLIINSIRSSLFKCIVSLFKAVLGINKKVDPAHAAVDPAAKKATQTILDTIYCLLENLIDEIIDFIANMLAAMIGNIVNPSLCAAEQFVSAILAKLIDLIDNALQTILSGISWLTGGISSVLNILSQASTLAQEIFNFIGDCGSIKCTQPSTWISSTAAALQISTDNWQKQLDGVNVLNGISNDLTTISNAITSGSSTDIQTINGGQLDNILSTVNTLSGGNTPTLGSLEGAISSMSLFGANNSTYSGCNESTFNPVSQSDLGPIPLGYTYAYCIPPIAEVVGDGTGAKVIPIVGDDKTIFAVEVINGGIGYTNQTTIVIIDNSGYGNSATAKAIVDSNGVIKSVVVINPGYGYCKGDYTTIGIGTTGGGIGIGTTGGGTTGVGIGTTTTSPGISSSIVGIVTDVYVINPGLGYTSGDTINVGGCTYGVVITNNGSIIGVSSASSCPQVFNTTPIITINTQTGVGAKLKPIMKFTPQSITAIKPTDTKVVSVVDCP